MQQNNIFLGSELKLCSPDSAYFHIIPVPYEESVSYGGGTALGPQAIIDASQQLELLDYDSIPANLGIYTHEAINCVGSPEEVFSNIHNKVKSLPESSIPILLGGEHSVSYGALTALKKKHGEFGIIQFDAHADLRYEYEGSIWSHACVMRRATQDLGLPLIQFGVRALCLEEVQARKDLNIIAYDAIKIAMESLPDELLPRNFPSKLYISFDIDALDTSIMPATGTPVPGGLDWYTALNLLQTCVRGRQIIGMDMVEFAPIPGFHAYDFTAARLTYAMLGIVQNFTRRQSL